MKFLSVFVLFLLPSVFAKVRYLQINKEYTCSEETCVEDVFCYSGNRFADLVKIAHYVQASISFTNTVTDKDTLCVEYETDDQFSLRNALRLDSSSSADFRLETKMENRKTVYHFVQDLFSYALGVSQGDSNECHRKPTPACQMRFSPFGMSCFRICEKSPHEKIMQGRIRFTYESVINQTSLGLMVLGFLLIHLAPTISHRAEIYYLTGGTLGVILAVAVLFLIISRFVTRDGPTKSQLFVASFFQISALYVWEKFSDLAMNYLDYIALYVLTTFCLSIAFVHWLVKGQDGKVGISGALMDVAEWGLMILGIILVAAPIPSATYRVVTIVFLIIQQVAKRMYHFLFPPSRNGAGKDVTPTKASSRPSHNKKTGSHTRRTKTSTSKKTPESYGRKRLTFDEFASIGKRNTERELERLTQSAEFKDWLVHNHQKILIKDDDEEEELERYDRFVSPRRRSEDDILPSASDDDDEDGEEEEEE